MIIIIISFIDNLALFYLSLDGTLFPDEPSTVTLENDHPIPSYLADLSQSKGG